MQKIAIIILLLFAIGCETKLIKKFKEYEQVCQSCYKTWYCSEPIPPTIEWCYDCGQLYESGYELFKICFLYEDYTLEFMEHCKHCLGCRATCFTPSDWYERIDNL